MPGTPQRVVTAQRPRAVVELEAEAAWEPVVRTRTAEQRRSVAAQVRAVCPRPAVAAAGDRAAEAAAPVVVATRGAEPVRAAWLEALPEPQARPRRARSPWTEQPAMNRLG